MSERGPKVICWDMDETLGSFRGRLNSFPSKSLLTLRSGIRETLQDFSGDGFVQLVTSSGGSSYVDDSLRLTDLKKFFYGIFDARTTKSYDYAWGKTYRPVLEALGLSDEEICDDIIVVGDAVGDQPIDINGLVFIHLGWGPDPDIYHASVIRDVIIYLMSVDKRSFRQAFEKLYKSDVPADRWGEGKLLKLENGIALQLEYKLLNPNRDRTPKTAPVITILEAPGRTREHEAVL